MVYEESPPSTKLECKWFDGKNKGYECVLSLLELPHFRTAEINPDNRVDWIEFKKPKLEKIIIGREAEGDQRPSVYARVKKEGDMKCILHDRLNTIGLECETDLEAVKKN
jgi:hypothetical protein